MVEDETNDDEEEEEEVTKKDEESAAEPEATSSTKSTKKSTVTVDEASGVTTVEEIEEINDDDSSSGRSVEDIQAELEKDAEEEEVKKYKPDEDQVEEIKAARAKAKQFSSESGEFLTSFGVDDDDDDTTSDKKGDAGLGEKEDEEESKVDKIKDMNAYLDNILSDGGGKATTEQEMTPEQDKAVKAEIAYAMDEIETGHDGCAKRFDGELPADDARRQRQLRKSYIYKCVVYYHPTTIFLSIYFLNSITIPTLLVCINRTPRPLLLSLHPSTSVSSVSSSHRLLPDPPPKFSLLACFFKAALSVFKAFFF